MISLEALKEFLNWEDFKARFLIYSEYAYLWPPRPENAFPPSRLSVYSRMGSQIAQVKMNGTCCLVFVSPEKVVTVKTRHNTDHKAWKPTKDVLSMFYSLPGDGWYVFVAELLHSKVPGIRDILYINEVLVLNGAYLVGSTFEERQTWLHALFLTDMKGVEATISHFVLDSHTWLARNHRGDFSALFKKLDRPEHEGLVLKTANARLALCGNQNSNVSWQVKARRAGGNQNFAF